MKKNNNRLNRFYQKRQVLYSTHFFTENKLFFIKKYNISSIKELELNEKLLDNIGIDCLLLDSWQDGNNLYKIFKYIKPNNIDNLIEDDFYLLGNKMAKFHSAMDIKNNLNTNYNFVYRYEFFEGILDNINYLFDYDINIYDSLRRSLDITYNKLLLNYNDWGCIHGDLSINNVIFNQGCHIIDFDMLGYGPRVLDFIVLLNSLRDINLYCAFLKGYMEKRNINIFYNEFIGARYLSKLLCISLYLNIEKNDWIVQYILNCKQFCSLYILNSRIKNDIMEVINYFER